MKKFLYYITTLITFSSFNFVFSSDTFPRLGLEMQIGGTHLNELFNNESDTITFTGETITSNSYDYVSADDYICDNNITYINTNTIPVYEDIYGGIKASIKGENNISLQNWDDKEVIKSIKFSGNNFEYTGTFYLHPSINNIIFTTQKSIINNINIPTDNKTKNITINFPYKMRINQLNIGENLAININHEKQNTIYCIKINGSRNSSINFNNNSIIYQKYNNELKDIEIKSEKYKKAENIVE